MCFLWANLRERERERERVDNIKREKARNIKRVCVVIERKRERE